MDYSQSVEPKISIRVVFCKLLIQWRPTLIVAVIFALAATSFMHMRDMKVYEQSEQAMIEKSDTKEQTEADHFYTDQDSAGLIEENLLSLKEEEREDVERLVQMRESYWKLQQYLGHSVLMRLDPGNRRLLILQYMISVPEKQNQYLRTLANGYRSALEVELISAMRPYLEAGIDDSYIRELLNITAETELMNTDMSARLNIEVTLPEEIDTDGLQTAIDQVVKQQLTVYKASVCPHSIMLYWQGEKNFADNNLLNRQTDVYSRYTGLRNNITTFENSLSSEQSEIYESICKQLTQGKLEDTEVVQGVQSAPEYSKKWAAAGFVLGIIVYAVLYILYLCLRGCIRSKEEVQAGWKLRVLGEVFLYSKKGFLRFVESRTVFNLIHRGKTELERQANVIADIVSTMSKHYGIEQVSFVPVLFEKSGRENQKWQYIWEVLSGMIESKGIAASTCNVFVQEDIVNQTAMEEMHYAVPIIFKGISSYAMMNKFMSDAAAYDVELMGAVMIEG